MLDSNNDGGALLTFVGITHSRIPLQWWTLLSLWLACRTFQRALLRSVLSVSDSHAHARLRVLSAVLFKAFDADKSGFIQKDEMAAVLKMLYLNGLKALNASTVHEVACLVRS